jgi:hypothetical protein
MSEIDGIPREEAERLINTAPNAVIYIVDIIKANPVAFFKIQSRGILRTVTAVEYRTWAEAISGVKLTGSGIVSEMNLNPSRLIDQIRAGNSWILLGIFALLVDALVYCLALLTSWRLFSHYRKDPVLFGIISITLITVIYTIVLPLGHGSARFRIPVEPMIALLGGMAFYHAVAPSPAIADKKSMG